jgi:ribosome biogenesis GTPase A
VIDIQRASEILIHEIRSGTLGRLSFETPEMVESETSVEIPDEIESEGDSEK